MENEQKNLEQTRLWLLDMIQSRGDELSVLTTIASSVDAALKHYGSHPLDGSEPVPPTPTARVPLRSCILDVLAFRGRRQQDARPLDEIVRSCLARGWHTRSANPNQLVYEQLHKLVAGNFVKRSGKPRAYRYRLA